MADAPVIRRTRARVLRVRTGCVTCKTRHLKCGEEKPSCRQCISAGFKCDGYKPPQPAKPRKTVATRTSVDAVAPLAAQKRMLPNAGYCELNLYQRYVAPKISSYSDAGFWNVFIPQMSQTEPAIQHAVVAICAAYRGIESSRSCSQPSILRPDPLAVKKATQAMQSLSQRINSDPNSKLVPLVACLLFTCLELLCGNFETAIVHVANGFRILNTPGSTELAGRSRQQIADMNTVDKEVAPVFQHLSVFCLLFGQTDVFDTSGHVATTECATFTSLESARLNLFELFSQVFRFIKVAGDKVDKESIELADLIEKAKLERRLQHWHSCMEQYSKNAARLGRHVNESAMKSLQLHHRVILVWLSVCLSVDGAELNFHTSNFEEIVRLCESLVRGSASRRNSPGLATTSPPQTLGYNKFSFGMGMIPSLYWVARECRDPTIRDKAWDLLRRAPLCESLWDVHVFSRIAERANAIRDSREHSQKTLSLPEDCLRGDLSLASDHRIRPELHVHNFRHVQTYRIHNDLISNDWSSDQRLGVTFRAKPWEPLGAWHI